MKLSRLECVPICLGLLLMGTFIATFIVAVALDHVKPDFPFISDTASLPPESSIFSQFINVAFLLMILCVYFRYLHVEECNRILEPRISRRCNKTAVVLGIVGSIGLDILSNFQEVHVLPVHLFGAFLCFMGGTSYTCVQAYISWKLYPEVTNRYILWTRILIAVFCVILTSITAISAGVAIIFFRGDNLIQWRPEHGGWEPRLTSAIAEWLDAICYSTFFATFASEFRRMTLQESLVRVELKDTEETVSGQVTGSSKL